MSELVTFPIRPLPVQPDLLDRRPEPATVSKLVPTYLRSRWRVVESEALRIAAGVGGASVNSLLMQAKAQLRKWGASDQEIEQQLDDIESFVDARLELYREITGLPGRGSVGHRRRV